MNQLLVYTETTTARLHYAFGLLLTDLLGLQLRFTTSSEEFLSSTEPKFSYSKEPLGDELHFTATTLLFEKVIVPQVEDIQEHNGLKGLFRTGEKSAWPFDPFASAFFFVSRYEEYLAFKKDKYGRYRASQSVAVREAFLEHPMVNYYALQLWQDLSLQFPQLEFVLPKFESACTIDVDNAWAFRGRGFRRDWAQLINALFFSRFTEASQRFRVIRGSLRDPNDCFSYAEKCCAENETSLHYFFMLADEGTVDDCTPHFNTDLHKLIAEQHSKHEVGVKFSFRSQEKRHVVDIEKKRLEEITLENAQSSRFNTLKLSFPLAFERLQQAKMKADYSMTYHSRPGFRASICTPFRFFNVRENECTNLMIHPVSYCDVALHDFRKMKVRDAMKAVERIARNTHRAGGTFVSLWNNASLSERGSWVGWRKVFEHSLRFAALLKRGEAPNEEE